MIKESNDESKMQNVSTNSKIHTLNGKTRYTKHQFNYGKKRYYELTLIAQISLIPFGDRLKVKLNNFLFSLPRTITPQRKTMQTIFTRSTNIFLAPSIRYMIYDRYIK